MAIKESKPLTISDKVLSLENVRDLANIIWDQYLKHNNSTDSDTNTSKDTSIIFSVQAAEGNSYVSDDISIFNDDSAINFKKINSIEINFEHHDLAGIKLSLHHGNKDDDDDFSSGILVTGDDDMWVNGIIGKFQDVLSTIPEQYPIRRYKRIISWGFVLFTMYLIGPGLDLLNEGSDNYVPLWTWGGWGKFISAIFVALLFGGMIAAFFIGRIFESVETICPLIELQIGPNHMMTERKKRKQVGIFITALLIPVVLAIASVLFS